MNFICLDGKFLTAEEPALLVSNRSYRYGDGLFETMKVVNRSILLAPLHFERLFSGMSVLMMDIPSLLTSQKLEEGILQLCKKNKCEALARVRLSVYRGNGGLYDENQQPGYIIECWPLDVTANEIDTNGLVVDVFPDSRKSTDRFSNLKSASCQLYSLAALFAKKNKLNDCFVLNTNGNIVDSTIANIFIVKGGQVYTPPLSEGCVAGVMRQHLINILSETENAVEEKIISVDDILQADEVFLTNAVKGIRRVGQFRDKTYGNTVTPVIYQRLIKTILP